MRLVIGTFIFGVIRTLKKYTLAYDRFKLDVPNRCVMINKERIFFEEIDFVTVYEMEQPNALEKAFAWRWFNLYMTQIIFHLKDGYEMECTFTKRTTLYKALKQLKPYVPVRAYIEGFKFIPRDSWRIFIVVGILCFFIFLKMLFHN